MALPYTNYRAVEGAVRNLLKALGENPDREGLKDTPIRVAEMYSKVLDANFSDPPKFTVFKEESYDSIIIVKRSPFYAFCEHHLCPFQGHFAAAYVPNGKICGLSKLVRLFRWLCKRPTIQERITDQMVNWMDKLLSPKGSIVHVSAEHTCISFRGVQAPGTLTVTMNYSGVFKENVELRNQFLLEAGLSTRS